MSNFAKMWSCMKSSSVLPLTISSFIGRPVSSGSARLDEQDLPPVLPNPGQDHKSNRGRAEKEAGRCILSTLVSQLSGSIQQASTYKIASESVLFSAHVLRPLQQRRIDVIIGKATAMTQELTVGHQPKSPLRNNTL